MDNCVTLRKGRVTDIDIDRRQVRVMFIEDSIVSGWLKVLKNSPFIPQRGVEQKTEPTSGGSDFEAFAEHSHKIKVSPWIPNINDIVLCIYDAGFNGDGYVLGAI